MKFITDTSSQIVTNHLLHFLALDRSDPKKFQVLQLIAALLGWSEEQREQAGLANPKTASGTATPSNLSTSFNSLRIKDLNSYKRSPSTPNIAAGEAFAQTPDSAGPGRESLAELWSDFLQREADEGERGGGGRKGSVTGHNRRASASTLGRNRRESAGVGSPDVGRDREKELGEKN